MRTLALGLAACCAEINPAAAAGHVMLGAHVDYEGNPKSQTDFMALETAIGRKLAIDSDYEDWAAFPNTARINWDVQNGRQSMQSWKVVFQSNATPLQCATAVAIAAGTYDTQLARQAAAVKALKTPILIRFNYEMTDNVFNTCFTGFPVTQNLPLAGARYVAAWKHVVDIFRAAGVTNAKWVFAPSAFAYLKGQWSYFYPGATYVDWMAADHYNKSNVPASFATDPAINAFYNLASATGKPLMMSETAGNNHPRLSPDAQTLWLTTLQAFFKAKPALMALVYWNDQGQYYQANPNYGGSGYTLQGTGMATFKAIANDPYFH